MAAAFKQTTNLTGLPVSKNPKYILNRIYNRLGNILTKMPQEAAYRKNTEEVIAKRSMILNSTNDMKEVEEKIGCGQIEELIEQGRRELELAQSFLIMKPWEKLMTPIPKNQWKWPMA